MKNDEITIDIRYFKKYSENKVDILNKIYWMTKK